MRWSSILLACASMILPAHAGGAHLLFDTADCYNIFPSGYSPQTTTIRARLPSEGISEVEFAVRGVPIGPGLFLSATPHPDASVEGDPFGGGVRMRFTDCKSGFITLYTITFLKWGDWTVGLRDLSFGPHSSPSDPSLDCPVFMSCGSNPGSLVCTWGTVERPLATPSDPFPADGAVGVNPDVELRWLAPFTSSCWISQPMAHLYLGTDPNPPHLSGVDNGRFRPPTLVPNTRYFWRIAVAGFAQYAESPVWTFTTAAPIAVEGQSWSRIKTLYRVVAPSAPRP